MPRPAVFLDRDGVIVPDTGPGVFAEPFDHAADALQLLRNAGFALVAVTNQTAVARGLATLDDVAATNARIEASLGFALDRWEVCPHHPNATLEAFREACECRKPRPGMLLRAAGALDLDLASSWMIGDRPSDIAAGARAGCRTILVATGRHRDAPIESPDAFADVVADLEFPSLREAAAFVAGRAR